MALRATHGGWDWRSPGLCFCMRAYKGCQDAQAVLRLRAPGAPLRESPSQ